MDITVIQMRGKKITVRDDTTHAEFRRWWATNVAEAGQQNNTSDLEVKITQAAGGNGQSTQFVCKYNDNSTFKNSGITLPKGLFLGVIRLKGGL